MTIQALPTTDAQAVKIAKSNMSGGTGDASYAKNSQSQAHVFNFCEIILYSAFSELRSIPKPVGALRLADLGCATGRNTLNAVKSMLDLVKTRFRFEREEMPEVETFFSDLPSNDFNALFQELPPLHHGSNVSLKDFRRNSSKRIFFAGGVPGSFFKERLFPSKSMHIISSFSAIHWLSEVPAAITDKTSEAYNRNRIFFDGAPGPVKDVIAQQSAADLRKFLQFRAEELVSGGILVLMFGARLEKGRPKHGRDLTEGIEEFQGLNESGDLLQQSFQELVAEGVIEADKLDTFNISAYSRSLAEVKQAIKECGQFDIHLLENVARADIIPAEEKRMMWPTAEAFGKSWANKTSSVTSGLITSHIGSELSNILFQRLESNATKQFQKFSKIRMSAIVAILVRRS
eukprot:TRINITY_DN12458_c0_g1_i1.p1 TRINITY_DN12458_c0_g1~~TRINITY_DN12458_c0_g1_i1.p1  ORF type:complete len:474 (-),score=64.33 TRINITY_DN12458_c0_g1_i1:165-1373(-)